MGLDMYLEAHFYVHNWDHNPPEKQYTTTVVNKAGEPIKLPCEPSYIVCQIGYWRKANHIHRWFVDNVQDGVDDCRNAYCTLEQLKDLLETCKLVLKNSKLVPGKICIGHKIEIDKLTSDKIIDIPTLLYEDGKVIEDFSIAAEHLPTTEGFFFGSTDYNEFYLNDVIETIAILEKCITLEDITPVDFYYHSSW